MTAWLTKWPLKLGPGNGHIKQAFQIISHIRKIYDTSTSDELLEDHTLENIINSP